MHTKLSLWLSGFGVILLGVLSLSSRLTAADSPWPSPVMVLAFDSNAAEEGSDPATFLVVRGGPANAPLTVNYLLGGEAENGADYEPLSGSVTIPQGAQFAPVTVTPIDDFQIEGSESVIIALQQPPEWPPAYVVTWPSVALAEIADNDRPPTNQPPSVSLVRPPDGAVFGTGEDIPLVARAFDRDGRVATVEFFANNRSLGTVTNQPSIASTGADLALLENIDPLLELDASTLADVDSPGNDVPVLPRGQVFRLIWSNAPPGDYVLTALATDNDDDSTRSEPIKITVEKSPPVQVVTVCATDPVGKEPDSTSDHLDTATFTIHRRGATNDALRVFYRLSGTASNGVDYVELPYRVEIPAGQRIAEVVVKPIDDLLVEGLETVVLSLVSPPYLDAASPLPDAYRIGRAHTARAWIRDNDHNLSPKLEIVRPSSGDIFREHSNVKIEVATRDPDGWVGRMQFYANDRLIGEQQINFFVAPPPGQPQKFSLIWSNAPAGEYALSAVATDDQGASTRSDPVPIAVKPLPDLPVVTIHATDPVATEQSPLTDSLPDTAEFEVRRLGGDSSRSLTVFYRIAGTASNGLDYVRLSGEVILPENAEAASILVDPIDDRLVEGTESVMLALRQPPCLASDTASPGCYLVGQPDRAIAFVRDNDAPPNQAPKVAIVSPPDGAVYCAPTDVRLAAAARDPDGWVASVEFFDGDTSLGVVRNDVLVIDDPVVRLTEMDDDVLSEHDPAHPFRLLWRDVPAGKHVLTALATDNMGKSSRSRPIEITVRDSHEAPVVRIMAVDPIAREGTMNTAAFRVHRTGATNAPLTVYYSVRGSASNGVDYETLPGSVMIPEGRHTARIVIKPIDDSLPERIETVRLRLVPPAVASETYVVGHPSHAAAIILDNDCQLQAPDRVADGSLHLRLKANPGMPYRLEMSTNLLDWAEVVSDIAAEDTVSVVDPDSADQVQRFYRVIQEFGDVAGDN